jgi:hypothetical protein
METHIVAQILFLRQSHSVHLNAFLQNDDYRGMR